MSDDDGAPGAGAAVRVVVASGKGGTGKTTVATSLATVLAEDGGPVAYVDCDVEEPNGHLFLRPTIVGECAVSVPVPAIDAARCTECGDCVRACRFSALVAVGGKIVVIPSLCHGCGGCLRACPEGAIREVRQRVGTVSVGARGALAFVAGETLVGTTATPEVIRSTLNAAPANHTLVLDGPPGTSCPAVEAVRGADVALLVTEPTPFGLHDLRLAVQMTRALGVPLGVAVNRVGSGDHAVFRYCRHERLPVLLELPDERGIAVAYSRGELAIAANPALRPRFVALAGALRALARAGHTGPAPAIVLNGQFDNLAGGGQQPAVRELVVISGKGGTGKTSIAACLLALAQRPAAVDADADAANLHLVLEPAVRAGHPFTAGAVAALDGFDCTRCDLCRDACRFDAIGVDATGSYTVDPIACEGCAVCVDVCPTQAIEMVEAPGGQWFFSDTRHGPLVHARLEPGRKNSGNLVSLVRREGRAVAEADGRQVMITDGSPGVGCPVIASIPGARTVLIVAEPTLSGLHDLRRVARLVRQMGVLAGVCVNKADLNPELACRLEVEASGLGVRPLGRVRYDPAVTAAQLARTSVVEWGDCPATRDIRVLWNRVEHMMSDGDTTTDRGVDGKPALAPLPWPALVEDAGGTTTNRTSVEGK